MGIHSVWLTVGGFLRDMVEERAILTGCFAGMRFVDASSWVGYYPKLLGIYERELHPIIDAIPDGRYSTIVNVGAAEGYFAVGLARKLPGTPVVAFDQDPKAQELIAHLAELNGVRTQIDIRGICTVEQLDAAIQSPAFMLMDVEGAEDELLDPKRVSGLLEADILVEVHDFMDRSIADRIRDRFEPTHRIREVWQESRGYHDLPVVPSRAQRLWWELTFQRPYPRLRRAVNEHRAERMRWLHLQRRNLS